MEGACLSAAFSVAKEQKVLQFSSKFVNLKRKQMVLHIYIILGNLLYDSTVILLIVPRMSALFLHRPPICERATDHTYTKGCSLSGKKCVGTK